MQSRDAMLRLFGVFLLFSVSHAGKLLVQRQPLGYIMCPGDQAQCPNGQTCCQMTNGQWGCCPLSNAICCGDNQHCCPAGNKCDVQYGRCVRQDGITFPWVAKQEAKPVNSVLCPDGKSMCPDGSTCCQLSSGQWGCCPLPNAVCCSDHEHCCPTGTTCDVKHGRCLNGDVSILWFEKTPATTPVEDVVCPDKSSTCPDGSTCCQLSSGQWGCCPLPNAICCSDHEHCCPTGTTCDVQHGRCLNGDLSMPWFEKSPATVKAPTDVVCPDKSSTCPDGSTCCQLSSGQWGCCPLPNAVCCSDHEHCCPTGTTCDVQHGRCLNGDLSMPWFEKSPATVKAPTDVVCPDKSSTCPDGSTCCQLSSGQWGCCPLPNAVCCSDHEHCCPTGTTCDVQHGRCLNGDLSMPWFKKTSATVKAPTDVVCPDKSSTCPDGSTCCQLSSGQWGCCPLPNAVCCSDHEHCCPTGTTCDVPHSKCNRQSNLSTRMFFVLDAKKSASAAVSDVVCPDKSSTCPDGSTCCQLSSGQWGCCPLPNAVCCSDHEHCCPTGTTCDVQHGRCLNGDLSVPWFKKTPAIVKALTEVN